MLPFNFSSQVKLQLMLREHS